MLNSTSRFLKCVGGCIIAGFLLLILYATLSRYLLNRPIDYSDELAALLFVTSAFIGILSSALDNDHIEINILTQRLGATWRTLCKRVSAVVCVVFFGLFSYQSFVFADFSYQIGALTEAAALPVSYWMYVMPLASAIACLAYAYRVFFAPRSAAKQDERLDRSAEN
ncbi:TRAP transporter small permease [Roseovarius confluentis]|uniref:TRAP transporter small permease n=1 Tax=Roseovarius confluentis TaxID=1852027 RepID=UPI000CDE4674|nr:TRAP transporter small permease [Roseovarius confluentis]